MPEPQPPPLVNLSSLVWNGSALSLETSLHPKLPITVHLRLTTPCDLDFVVVAEQAEQAGDTIGCWSREEHYGALQSSTFAHYIIERDSIERDSDRYPVGYLILQDVNHPHRNLQLRRIVVSEKRRGYGRAALRSAKQLAFATYGAYRFWLEVKPYNSGAHSLYQSEGFVMEGTLRDCVQLNSSHQLHQEGHCRVSLVVMSILRPEYDAQAKCLDISS